MHEKNIYFEIEVHEQTFLSFETNKTKYYIVQDT